VLVYTHKQIFTVRLDFRCCKILNYILVSCHKRNTGFEYPLKQSKPAEVYLQYLACLTNSTTINKSEHQVIQAVHFSVDLRTEICKLLEGLSIFCLNHFACQFVLPGCGTICLATPLKLFHCLSQIIPRKRNITIFIRCGLKVSLQGIYNLERTQCILDMDNTS
jgi:hypothetical protein